MSALFSTLPADWSARVLKALFWLGAAWAATLLLRAWLNRAHAIAGTQRSVASLSRTVLQSLIFALAIISALSELGVSVTPILTALGVGSLAVALALQDTLGNAFAGFNILLSQQIDVGDYIRLDSGQEGSILDIGWRSCRLQELSGNLVIVPNTKLSQALVTNFDRPGKDLAVLVDVGVSYDSDLARVEQVVTEVARKTLQEVPGGQRDFQPFIRYNQFADSSIQFTVILRGRQYVDRYLLTHEFIKRLHARFKVEGIEIPFPQRTLHIEAKP